MKKIIIAFISMFSMLIFIATPLFIKPIKANAALPSFVNEPQPIFEDLWSDSINNENYVYSFNKLLNNVCNNNLNIKNTSNYFSMTYKQKTPSSYDYQNMGFHYDSADVSIDGNHIVIDNMVNGYIHSWVTYDNTQIIRTNLGKIDFDFDTFTFQFWDRSGDSYDLRYLYQSSWPVTDIWNVYTNIPDMATSPPLNVFVSFSPSLSGNVDRSINNNGVISMRSQLYMHVVNQSRFPIQYKMAIYKKHQQNSRNWDLTTSDNVFYDNDPIFVYYGDSWVYCTNCDDENTFLNADTVKENKSSPWHYVSASSQDIVTFDFNQINMLEGEEYTVYVYAVRNDYGFASEQIVYLASSDPALSALYQIQGDNIETVYQSDFVMINYNDVKYDPNNTNNGVKPFNGRDGFAATQQYSYSRNARENQDGTIDYSSRNLYTNQNSWLSQQRSNALANHSTYSSGRVPASLSTHFNNFLSFITAVFGRMPTDIQSLYIYGFIALVVLGIVLKVVK